jgi:hypothetical protein
MDSLTLSSGRVVGRAITKNKDGTKKVLLMQVEITDPDDIQSVELMNHTGEESNPVVNSRSVILKIGDAWKIAVATDDLIEPITDPGEKRLYSTDENGSAVVAQIHLKNDGEIFISNGVVTITAKPDGDLIINTDGESIITSSKTIINNDVDIIGKLTVTGDVECAKTIRAIEDVRTGPLPGNLSFNAHLHSGVDSGPNNTGGPVV